VWVGYDQGHLLSSTESHLAAPIWADFMQAFEQKHVPLEFAKPAGLKRVKIDPLSGELATSQCAVTETDYFLKENAPTLTCTLHPEKNINSKNNPSSPSIGSWVDSLWKWMTGK